MIKLVLPLFNRCGRIINHKLLWHDILNFLFSRNSFSIYDDVQNLYSNIYNSLHEFPYALSINDMIKLIMNESEIFLKYCDYKPLNVGDLTNPEHKFHCLLTVIAVASDTASFSVIKDLLRITGASLMKQSVSMPDELEVVEYLFLETYTA